MTRQAQRAIAQGAASARLFFPGFGWLVFDGARWRHEDVADALDVFLKTCVAPSPGGRVQAAALREALNEWQRLNGGEPMTLKRLAGELQRRGLKKTKSSAVWWLDIKFVSPPAPCGRRISRRRGR
jgi:hypothetical protein